MEGRKFVYFFQFSHPNFLFLPFGSFNALEGNISKISGFLSRGNSGGNERKETFPRKKQQGKGAKEDPWGISQSLEFLKPFKR